MGRTLTNNLGLQYSIEESLGQLADPPSWKQIEPNEITTLGATITTVARNPISKNRQRRKGTITDLDSSFEFTADLTLDAVRDFAEGFVFSRFVNGLFRNPSAVTSTAYTVASTVAAVPQRTLVYGRGFQSDLNNGLKVVATGSTLTSIPAEGGLTAETPAATANASVEVAGFRFTAGDLQVNSSGNLTSTTKDFTALPISVGQAIYIGGSDSANQFAQVANKGYARVRAIATNLLTLDKKSTTFVTDTGTGKEVDIYFGQLLKNVPVDDANFVERSFQFEGAYQGLGNPTGDEYEYSKGNYCNTIGFDLPLTDKATFSASFIGTDTAPPSSARATNADTPLDPVMTAAFNTTADFARLRITDVDESGLTTDFKSVSLTLNNNVSPEKVLGVLGARFMNIGNFQVDLEAQLLFTDSDVIAAVRENRTVTMEFTVKNDDGALFVDLPALTLGGGNREYPVDQSILVNVTCQTYGDPIFNASLLISVFPYIPA